MFEIKFHDKSEVDESTLKFVVIVAKYEGKLVYCRHKERTTYEIAGGHIEEGETALEAAKRELFEETGAIDFDIDFVSDYSYNEYGSLYYAEIKELEQIPEYSEIAEIVLVDTPLDSLTYPHIQPFLLEKVNTWLENR